MSRLLMLKTTNDYSASFLYSSVSLYDGPEQHFIRYSPCLTDMNTNCTFELPKRIAHITATVQQSVPILNILGETVFYWDSTVCVVVID